MEEFRAFLSRRNIQVPPSNGAGDTLESLVSSSFDYLGEKELRDLASEAVRARDRNAALGVGKKDLLGSWAVILDAVHQETRQRQERGELSLDCEES